jgi:site-specific recombinase
MTQTIQPRSLALLSETGKDLTIDKPEAEDNLSLLLQIFDNLNDLYEKLDRLRYVIQRKKIEQILCQKGK